MFERGGNAVEIDVAREREAALELAGRAFRDPVPSLLGPTLAGRLLAVVFQLSANEERLRVRKLDADVGLVGETGELAFEDVGLVRLVHVEARAEGASVAVRVCGRRTRRLVDEAEDVTV